MGKGRWPHGGCFHDPKLQSMWMKTAGLALLIGPIVVFVAFFLQDDFSWSEALGIAPTKEAQPSSTSPSNALRSSDASCLSRAQHLNYRPASQLVSPSTAWEKAFQAYEKFHTDCSQGRNWTSEFLGDRVQNSNNTSRDSSRRSGACRVLVYTEGPAGLGNRMLSLVSAFLYSLLTKRVFLLDSRGHLAKLLCEPFHDSSWLLPTDFPFEALDEASTLAESMAMNSTTTRVVSLHLDHAQSSGDQRFFCSETRQRLEFVPWLAWTSNQYYVPRYFTFPELWRPLAALFPNVSLTFTRLSRALLLPSNSVWQKIVRIHSSYLSQADELVGIQIRRHSVANSGEYDHAAFHRILSCLIGAQILPDFGPPGRGGGKAAMGASRPRPPPRVSYALLVTSLQLRFFEELRDVYANRATVDGSLVRVHMVSHEGMEWHSFDQAQKAFVEIWLLSLSHRIATSSWSTFGYIAQGLGAMRPLMVDLRGEISEQKTPFESSSSSIHPYCYFGQSIEPCNHYPFYPTGSQCSRNQTAPSAAHLTWIRNHLRPCQDFPQGLQLVV